MIVHKQILLNYIYDWTRTTILSKNKSNALCVVSGGIDSILNATILLNSSSNIPVNIIFMGYKEKNEEIFKTWLDSKYSPDRYKIIKPSYPVIDDDELKNIDIRYSMVPAFVDLYSELNQSVTFGAITKSEYSMVNFFKKTQECFDFYPLIDLYKSECKELAFELDLPKSIIDSKSLTEDSFGYSFEDIEWLDRENENTNLISSASSPMNIPHWALFNSQKKALIFKIYNMKKTNDNIRVDSSKKCSARMALPGVLI